MKAPGKRDTPISVRTYAELKNRLEEIASSERRSIAMQIEVFLEEAVERWEKDHEKKTVGA
jgi:hypothetical protein